MGGWHAGKFDFDSGISGVTALNYEKAVVFGNPISETTGKKLAPLEDAYKENLPRWATRSIDYRASSASIRVHRTQQSKQAEVTVFLGTLL
jgi:hypothetical protein